MTRLGARPEAPIDGSPLSVIVPFRVDMPDRLRNLETITAYLGRYFPGAETILVEMDARSKVPHRLAAQYDAHVFIKDGGPFAKARAVNDGLLRSTRPIVAFYDVDVLVHPAAAQEAVETILRGSYPVVLPFNGTFLDIGGETRDRIMRELTVGDLAVRRMSEADSRPDIAVRFVDGGVFFARRDLISLEGGFNRKMISYGWEDLEVLMRLEKLGYYKTYLKYNLIHLDHARGPDSVRNEHYERNREEYDRVAAMSRSELRRYVETDLALDRDGESRAARDRLRRETSRSSFGLARASSLGSKIRSRLAQRTGSRR